MVPFLGHWVQRGRVAGVGKPLVNSRKPPRQEAVGLPQQEAGGPPFCGSDSASESAAPTFVLMTGLGEPSHCSLRGLVFSSCIKTVLDLDANFISFLGEGSQIVEYVGCQLRVVARD